MPEQQKGDGVTSNALKCDETRSMDAQHVQVVALRIQGKRWSEIAAALGVVPQTIWRWREEYPEIDRAILAEAHDYLVASRVKLATLLPLANQKLEDALNFPAIEPKDVIAANKLLAEVFKAVPANTQQPIPRSSVGSNGAGAPLAGRTTSAVISDAELDRVLDARVADDDPGDSQS